MSLFGAMNAGVSGLASQSSAMAAISDNITNVNTIGYKGTKVDFQTLVTRQSSNTHYASGGVRRAPAATSTFRGCCRPRLPRRIWRFRRRLFLVNEAAQPGSSDQYMFSRAGSFYTDDLGFLKNTGGYYLQGWPTDRQGNIVLPSNQTGLTNQNIISNQFLETINLNRVGGTADETTNISIGANLPAFDAVGGSHDIDVQFFDTLGNSNAAAFTFAKSATNQWDLTVEPPKDPASVTLYDGAGSVYRSTGQLEFTAMPTAGNTVVVNGTTYTYGGANWPAAVNLPAAVANLVTAIGGDAAFGTPASGKNTVALKNAAPTTILLGGGSNAAGSDFTINAAGCSAIRESLLQSPTFGVFKQGTPLAPAIAFNSQGVPAAFGVTAMAVTGFVSGAASMDGSVVDVNRIALDFGSKDEADGITQLSAEFTPNFIEQDGARFGTFSGVTISSDGQVRVVRQR
ncbi:MAG: hypothetical protein IPK78_02655 [Rhodospirillales bacterium]|nr:hypothetical protein [Rhodospirillales bacterium]